MFASDLRSSNGSIRCAGALSRMIGVTITGKAYAVIAPTLPAGSVAEKEIDPGLEYQIWLPKEFVIRLMALRKPGETFNDVILRLRATRRDLAAPRSSRRPQGERDSGATKMPIRRYVEYGVFRPEVLSAMNKALEDATEILEIGSDEIKHRAVAQLIIGMARLDDSLDSATLRDRAVGEFRNSPSTASTESGATDFPRAAVAR